METASPLPEYLFPEFIEEKRAMKPKSLFPYFGGKSKIAPLVWEKFGNDIRNYVEPFVGSAAVFFAKPYATTSTLNDASGLMVNLWRAIKRAPGDVSGAVCSEPA